MTPTRTNVPTGLVSLLCLMITVVASCTEAPEPTAPDPLTAVGPQRTQVDLPNQITPVAVSLLKADQVSGTIDGQGITVGIVDDGFYTGHEDLLIDQCVTTSYQSNPCDGGWHGNIAAGVLKARNNTVGIRGVAPGVTLKVCKAHNNTEREACINAMASNVDILSLSWPSGNDSSLHNSIINAYNQGVLIFAEANNRWNGSNPPSSVYPAAWPEVIGVSGAMPNGVFADKSLHNNSYYESYCPPQGTQYDPPDLVASEWGDASNHGSYVELAGPFYTISTRKPTQEFTSLYRHVCGTSFATPAVAGVAALVLDANGGLSRDQVRTILQETAVDQGSSSYYGHGLVDAAAAVDMATEDPPPPPPPHIEVTLSGPSVAVEHAEEQCVWEAVTSGGSGTKTYEWYYDYQRVYPNPWVGENYWYGDTGYEGQHTLTVVVYDDTGADSDEMNITVDNQWAECGW